MDIANDKDGPWQRMNDSCTKSGDIELRVGAMKLWTTETINKITEALDVRFRAPLTIRANIIAIKSLSDVS